MNKIYHGFSHCSGIYKITNIENGDVYFGQAAQLGTRVQQHEKALIAGAEGRVNSKGKLIKHPNRYLQAAWNKYKSDAFEFEVIAVYPDKTERDAAEQALIDEHYGPGCYNLQPKVSPAPGTWSHTPEETRAKHSAALKGIPKPPRSPEHCAAIGAAKQGLKHSPEHCAAIGAGLTGKKREPRSPEWCAALSAAHIGQIPWNKKMKKI